jgi:GT2 family glycosyltransferase
MRLSVIIPAYNCLPQVVRAWRTIRQTMDPALTEVLIQDDASPEYNGPALFGEVCQRNPINLGFAANCNTAAKRAGGEILLFLNQDCYADQPGWDAALLALFDCEPRCGIAGPTLLFPDGRIQSVGGRFDAFCQPYHEALGFSNPDWPPIRLARPVSWITGAALAIRRGVWDELGGFDPAYAHGYWEDVDLCVRAQRAGWHIWHTPEARLFHEAGSTGGSPHFRRNMLLFKRRYVDTRLIQPESVFIKTHCWA